MAFHGRGADEESREQAPAGLQKQATAACFIAFVRVQRQFFMLKSCSKENTQVGGTIWFPAQGKTSPWPISALLEEVERVHTSPLTPSTETVHIAWSLV